jgi:hypothetical protein
LRPPGVGGWIARQGGHFPGGVCGAQRPGNVQFRRLPPSGSAVTHRIEMRRPCALGSTCASAATSFGRQRAAVAAMRIDGWLGAGVRKSERMPTRSPRRRRVRLEGDPCRGSTFASEPRPRACTPGAMDARHWSGLMCLETQGMRGGRQKLVLDGCCRGLEPHLSGQCLFKRGSALEAALAAGCGEAAAARAVGSWL